MKEVKKWKIIQIIPAQPGWKAVHCQESADKQMEIFNRPVICWALVEAIGASEPVSTQVRGIEQESNELIVVEDLLETGTVRENGRNRAQHFLGYNSPEAHKETDYWINQANRQLNPETQRD